MDYIPAPTKPILRCAPCHTSFGILNIRDLHSLRLVVGRDLSDPGDGFHLHPTPVPFDAVDDAG